MGAVARSTPPSPAVQPPRTLRDGPAVCSAAAALFAILPLRATGRLRCHRLSPPALRARHAAVLTPRAQLQEGLEAVSVSSVEASVEVNTVHVRFTLKRECLFGQQFFIVGNDPNLGLWDTSSALPLEWSEGHVWTAQLDLPVGKSVKYKFILRGLSGEIEWQPGEDRVLQPWETTKTIVVMEEWENAEMQKIAEKGQGNNGEQSTVDEEPTPVPKSVLKDGSLRTNETVIPEENLEVSTNKLIHVDADNEKIKQKQNNDKSVLVPGLPRESALVSGLPLSPIFKVELSKPSTPSTSNDKLGAVSEEGLNSAVISNHKGYSTSPRSAEPENTASRDETESTPKVENKEKGPMVKVEDKEKGPMAIVESTFDESIAATSFKDQVVDGNGGAQDSLPAAGVVRNDIQWGRETLNKFLSTLGLFQGGSA